MQLKLPSHPGYAVQPTWVQQDGQWLLQVNTGTPQYLMPHQTQGVLVVEATPEEWAQLKEAGYQLERVPELKDHLAGRMLLPVGRSGWAIAAGYAGLFALIVFPAPLALVLGIVAIWHLKKNPEKYGWGRALFGFITGLLGTAVLIAAWLFR